VARERPEGDGWAQSDDVLDTWFSSALWPYATLGWPERTPDLETWYPGDVLVTARDIINLWVARMLMTGLEFLGEPPFTDVYIHSVIQAPDGRRMSKSLGTGIDPLELIDAYGADATRYGLLKMSSTQDVRFAPGAIEEGRGLANKIWNAARLILLNAAPDARPRAGADEPVDRWILSRLRTVTEEVTASTRPTPSRRRPRSSTGSSGTRSATGTSRRSRCASTGTTTRPGGRRPRPALYVLERVLGLLHPAMPFVTEEIWSFLPGERGLLMTSPFPTPTTSPPTRSPSGP
jgi:valyl-tRNA synthetase